MWEDPIVEDVRRIRDALAGEDNYDLHTVFERMRERQTAVGSRLIHGRQTQATSPDRDSASLHPGR